MIKHMKILTGLVTCAVLTACTACGTKEVQINVDELGSCLMDEISYSDSLSELDLDTASMFMDLSGTEITDSFIAESSGATAEEIVVLECADEENAALAKKCLDLRVSEQTEAYTDYVPAELIKLDNAVIVTAGRYAILSVSDDPDIARSIIGGYTK